MVAFGRQARCDPCGIWRIYDALWRKTMVVSRCFKMFQDVSRIDPFSTHALNEKGLEQDFQVG